MDIHRAIRQQLEDYQRVGITHVPAGEFDLSAVMSSGTDEPVAVTKPPVQPVSQQPNIPAEPIQEKVTPPVMPANSDPLSREERVAALDATATRVAACKKCEALASTRTQTVFGVGNPEAEVMFIGEAPGADEDKQGEPFVGRAGQLLTKIIEACGWKRSDIYICNILRCRPPGNRNPTSIEADNCREFLDEQIRIVRPKYIVCWGTIAAQNLLGRTDAIGKLRQTFFEHGDAKVLCTYHPSYLLRNPSAKKPVWEDMKILLTEMGIDPETLPSAQSKA